MEQKEFTIKSFPNYSFRVGKITPIEYLAINSFIDFKSFDKTEKVFTFVLEHLEVNINGVWTKVKDGDLYMPLNLANKYNALEELVYYFLHEILMPLFQESKE